MNETITIGTIIVFLGPFLFIIPFWFLLKEKLRTLYRNIISVMIFGLSFATGGLSYNNGLVSFDFASILAGIIAPPVYLAIVLLFLYQFTHIWKAPSDKPSFHVDKKTQRTKKRAARIFISYRRADSNNVTGRIFDRLSQNFGKNTIFKDVDSIPLGVDFRKHLDTSVGECQILLAIIGKDWLTISDSSGKPRLYHENDFVRIEIESALERDIPVIPILVNGASMPLVKELPKSLSNLAFRNGIEVRNDPDFHRDMDRLIKNLEIHLEN